MSLGQFGTSSSTAKELVQMNLFDLSMMTLQRALDVRDNCNKSLGSTQLRIYTPEIRPTSLKTARPPRAEISSPRTLRREAFPTISMSAPPFLSLTLTHSPRPRRGSASGGEEKSLRIDRHRWAQTNLARYSEWPMYGGPFFWSTPSWLQFGL